MIYVELKRGDDKSPLYLFGVTKLNDGTLLADGYFCAHDISITEPLHYENRVYYLVKPIKGDAINSFMKGLPEPYSLEKPIELETF